MKLHLRKVLLVLLLLVAVTAFGIYWANRLESYEDTLDYGPSIQARSNLYLAAEQFLRQQGVTISGLGNLQELGDWPASGKTLLYFGLRQNISRPKVQALLQWVEKGGHLLLIAEQPWDEENEQSDDPLFDALGIQAYPYDDLECDEEDEEDAQSGNEPRSALFIDDEVFPASFSIPKRYDLYLPEAHARLTIEDACATQLIQFAHGQGKVTAIAGNVWRNSNIGNDDHAWLLWYLTHGTEVKLFNRNDSDTLFSRLLHYFPHALCILSLLIGASLWHAGMRYGPLLAPASRARRRLDEHLRASAKFLLLHAGHPILIGNLQRNIRQRAQRRYPGFEHLSAEEQWEILSRLSQQPVSTIRHIMQPIPGQTAFSATQFTRQVAHLQSLRNAL